MALACFFGKNQKQKENEKQRHKKQELIKQQLKAIKMLDELENDKGRNRKEVVEKMTKQGLGAAEDRLLMLPCAVVREFYSTVQYYSMYTEF
jgi:hypothetical protein